MARGELKILEPHYRIETSCVSGKSRLFDVDHMKLLLVAS